MNKYRITRYIMYTVSALLILIVAFTHKKIDITYSIILFGVAVILVWAQAILFHIEKKKYGKKSLMDHMVESAKNRDV
ncbi:hypothetical protein SAMN04487934_11023 [Eubacterium ruminantium]|nr:hypothetical protein SAMN04487934_11023 [Eubacterium ruminantium]